MIPAAFESPNLETVQNVLIPTAVHVPSLFDEEEKQSTFDDSQ